MVKILSLSWLKKALTIFLWFPLKVNGKNPLILCKLIILTVKSSLQVMKNLESLVQLIPIISSECKFAYFLYKIRGLKVLCMISGLSKILNLFPVATPKNLESGEKVRAVTLSLKLKWAIITCFWKLIIRANPSTSTVMRIFLSGDKTTESIFDLFWKGSVLEMLLKNYYKECFLLTWSNQTSSVCFPLGTTKFGRIGQLNLFSR